MAIFAKHKLDLMFSSIEPCDPPGRIFPATSFLLFVPQTHTCIPHYFYRPMKRQLARVLTLPANQLCAVFSCLRPRSQSIFTCNSVKLLDRASSVLVPLWLLWKVHSPPSSYHTASTNYHGCLPPEPHWSWELNNFRSMEMNKIQTVQNSIELNCFFAWTVD